VGLLLAALSLAALLPVPRAVESATPPRPPRRRGGRRRHNRTKMMCAEVEPFDALSRLKGGRPFFEGGAACGGPIRPPLPSDGVGP
jgi:hypothetical protein